MKIFNFTPHTIDINDGSFFPPSGTVARVATAHPDTIRNDKNQIVSVPGLVC